MSDLISRHAAIDAVCMEWCGVKHQDCKHQFDVKKDDYYWCDGCETALRTLPDLPSAQPEPHYDEWCTDCKEYDQERHCCPRWNRVIRETLRDAQEIIHCKYCAKCQYDTLFDQYWCNGREVREDFYCADGERRTDE